MNTYFFIAPLRTDNTKGAKVTKLPALAPFFQFNYSSSSKEASACSV